MTSFQTENFISISHRQTLSRHRTIECDSSVSRIIGNVWIWFLCYSSHEISCIFHSNASVHAALTIKRSMWMWKHKTQARDLIFAFSLPFIFFTIDECSTDSNEMNILWVPIFRLHTHNLGYRFRLQSFCNFTTNENHSKSCRSISLTKDKFMGHKNWKSEAKRSTRITKDKWKENCRIQERNELELINGISTWKQRENELC